MICPQEREVLYVQSSLGFVRLALKHGVPLLPMYAFGETQLWRTHGALLQQRRWAAEHLRVGLPLVSGRLGTPLPLRMPYGHALIVGRPIQVGPATETPSRAELERVFLLWSAEVRRIFDAHKSAFLPPEVAARGLSIEIRKPHSRL